MRVCVLIPYRMLPYRTGPDREDQTLKIRNGILNTGVMTLRGHDRPVCCVIEVGSKHSISGSSETAVAVWDVTCGERLLIFCCLACRLQTHRGYGTVLSIT